MCSCEDLCFKNRAANFIFTSESFRILFLLFYHRELNWFCDRIQLLMRKRTMVKRQCMRRIPSPVNMNMGVTASGLLNIGK